MGRWDRDRQREGREDSGVERPAQVTRENKPGGLFVGIKGKDAI
jgi:hypothetical protein